MTWHALLHFIFGQAGFLCIITGTFIFARYFAITDQRGWMAYSVFTGSSFLVGATDRDRNLPGELFHVIAPHELIDLIRKGGGTSECVAVQGYSDSRWVEQILPLIQIQR